VKYSLYLETGIYSPYLRSLLTCLEILTGEIIEMPLDEDTEERNRAPEIFD
jgi:hypothetical protein